MDRNAFIDKQPPRQLDEIWEMEEKTEKPKGTEAFTAKKRLHHNLKFIKTIFYMQTIFFRSYQLSVIGCQFSTISSYWSIFTSSQVSS